MLGFITLGPKIWRSLPSTEYQSKSVPFLLRILKEGQAGFQGPLPDCRQLAGLLKHSILASGGMWTLLGTDHPSS